MSIAKNKAAFFKKSDYEYARIITPLCVLAFFLVFWAYLFLSSPLIQIGGIFVATFLMGPVYLLLWFPLMLLVLTIGVVIGERKNITKKNWRILGMNILYSIPITFLSILIVSILFVLVTYLLVGY